LDTNDCLLHRIPRDSYTGIGMFSTVHASAAEQLFSHPKRNGCEFTKRRSPPFPVPFIPNEEILPLGWERASLMYFTAGIAKYISFGGLPIFLILHWLHFL
jgi:hypothetical protein